MIKKPVIYNDVWILENWKKYLNWLSLRNEYNRVHDTDIGYTTFKSHCNRKLGLNFMYTKEQKKWLIDNYPNLGRVKAARQFNKAFGTNKSSEAIKNQAQKLGLKVTSNRKKERAIENTGRYHPVGSEVPGSHGEIYVKTENGFVRKKNLVFGDIPKGHALVHLDGNRENCEKDNLMPLSRQHLALMTANRFWSDNSTITKTGVLCCELETALKKERINYD